MIAVERSARCWNEAPFRRLCFGALLVGTADGIVAAAGSDRATHKLKVVVHG
jgi:hypothetical protein